MFSQANCKSPISHCAPQFFLDFALEGFDKMLAWIDVTAGQSEVIFAGFGVVIGVDEQGIVFP